MAQWDAGASAATVFAVLYAVLFLWMVWAYATRKIAVKSRFAALLFHVMIRLGAQGVGIAFAVLGLGHSAGVGLLVAFLTLGAEGYFSLVLCAYRFLIVWETKNLPEGSWLETEWPDDTPTSTKLAMSLSTFAYVLKGWQPPPMPIIHEILIVANVLIVLGGSMGIGDARNPSDFSQKTDKQKLASILRVTGQGIFVALNAFLLFCLWRSIQGSKRVRRNVHATLLLLLLAWPILMLRGVFGVMQVVYKPWSYLEPDNYNSHGLKTRFIVAEYIMGTSTEWIGATLLLLTYYTSKNDPKRGEVRRQAQEAGDKHALVEKGPKPIVPKF